MAVTLENTVSWNVRPFWRWWPHSAPKSW